MDVTVHFFAIFRESTGVSSHQLHTSAKTTKELFAEMSQLFPALQAEAAALVAINDLMVSWDHLLNEGDEVLFFPPVAGG
ncbi:MAG: molybdopterin converting factor subunit 1 [Lysobacterales bacterium]|jgi:molybdopterin converting factor subunit 1